MKYANVCKSFRQEIDIHLQKLSFECQENYHQMLIQEINLPLFSVSAVIWVYLLILKLHLIFSLTGEVGSQTASLSISALAFKMLRQCQKGEAKSQNLVKMLWDMPTDFIL